MDGRTNIAAVGWAVGDPSRASMLSTLMCGQALTAGELAREAGIAPSTASSHLAALADLGLVTVAPQGRHRYYGLANRDTAELLERLSCFANGPARQRGRTAPAMRRARTCYDHLAGEYGVRLFDAMVSDGRLIVTGQSATLSATGEAFARELGLKTNPASGLDCRPCLDFTERRPHLAGPLARQLLDLMRERSWLLPGSDRRTLSPTPLGQAGFDRHFPIQR